MVKVLAIGMKQVLGALLLNGQNAFIGGKQILDLVLIANECLDSRLISARSEIRDVMCKQDLEKTYDHVNWKFLS
jgi:hypothetical protein